MKKALFLYALAVSALLLCTLRHYRSENRRLKQNQTALTSDLHHYRTRLGEEAASAQDPLRRTPHEALLPDSLRRFRWSDPWVTVEGILGRDSVVCRIESRDTLRQIVHRIPRHFLFIRWGTKALRQEIISSNPHTRIVYSEYIQIER